MNVSLNPSLARFIQEQVKSGRYATANDAINAAVAQLQTERALSAADVDELRKELDEGIAEADRGDFVEFSADDVIAERRAARGSRKSTR